MKKIILIALTIGLLAFNSTAQNVGINGTGALAHPSALLDLSANDKGFLITRSDTLNIISPAFGLMTLNPVDSCLYLFNGINWMGLGGGGTNCSCNCVVSSGESTNTVYPPSYVHCGFETEIIDVTNPITGKTWMDRNLGASQVATSSTDAMAYGDLFQWGRFADGHQCRNPLSTTTTINATTDTPGHQMFILEPSSAPFDWRVPQNDNLWQGVNGVNNPCPVGYRIPTNVELDNERQAFPTNNSAGAFNSFLRLPTAGYRHVNNGTLTNVGSHGAYWSSTVNGTFANNLGFGSGYGFIFSNDRAYGRSVRCIKDN